jgi:phosphoribosylaminoimidazole (AIR) synthetase
VSFILELTVNVQTVAGIVSLINDYQLSKGRAPLGFLNLLLYGDGIEGLTDIISGSNPGCGTPGFSAIGGWDPVRPARLVSLHLLISGFVIGHGSRDAALWEPTQHT